MSNTNERKSQELLDAERYQKDLRQFVKQGEESEYQYFSKEDIWIHGAFQQEDYSQKENLLNYESTTSEKSNGLGDMIYGTQDSLALKYFVENLSGEEEIFIDVGSSVKTMLFFSRFAKCFYVDPRHLGTSPVDEFYANTLGVAGVQAEGQKLTEVFPEKCVNMVTSLHAPEHFGLGRYSDEIDYDGPVKFFKECNKVLKDDGTFIFSVPVSAVPRVEFHNARVYSAAILEEMMQDSHFEPESISLILGPPWLFSDISPDETDERIHYGKTKLDLKFELLNADGEIYQEALTGIFPPSNVPDFDVDNIGWNEKQRTVRSYWNLDAGLPNWAEKCDNILNAIENMGQSKLEHRCLLVVAKKRGDVT